MATADPYVFYTQMFTNLDTALTTYISTVVSDVIRAITPVATTLVTIYVMFWGWATMRGAIDEPVTDGAQRIVRLAVITGLALSVGNYNGYIANFLWTAPDAMASVVASGYSSGSSGTFLDGLMTKFGDYSDALFKAAHEDSTVGIPDLSMWFGGLFLWLIGILVTGYAAFLLALAKMALAILLGIGPIFIVLSMFEATKQFLNTWIGQVLNYLFLVILTAGAIKLILAILEKYLINVASSGELADPGLSNIVPALALSAIGFLVMMQLSSIASALGGGVAIGTLGAGAAMLNKLKGGASGTKNLLSGKTLSDMRQARRSKAANARWAEKNPSRTARAAGTAGRTVAAPAAAVYRKIANRKNSVAQG